ncbi:uncharacterized protein LOC119113653 [Pollicipes pollicipes]|uniref:uncharacterized protein LOC119113653 n=1 Tax=Pollicipes pollicipes TaxID=41117 RepID=UPI001884CEF8|nr:uncharacterized protein LOC119113653 [Pollicipes pollicipes]
MRVVPLLLLLCLAVIAVEGGSQRYCGRGKDGKYYCPKGQVCRSCGLKRCCVSKPANKCRRYGQLCGGNYLCIQCGDGLCCRLGVSLRRCRAKCKRAGYYCTSRNCAQGYCCERCYGKKC